jgi:uncharacterized protein YbjT (DUF2867 family)
VIDDSLFEGEFGCIRTVVEGPDGALYLLTSNRDSRGEPSNDDDRIIRLPSGVITASRPQRFFPPVNARRASVLHMIVITTPTGQIGDQVVANLLDSGEPIRVIARDPSRLPWHVRARVEVEQGSHGDIDVVTRAFAGADAVFWLVPPDPRAESVESAYVDFTRPASDAFKSQGVKRVVGVSALGRGVTDNAGLVSASLAMDDLIASTGVSYRALTMPSFMDNILRQVEPIKHQGLFFSPISGDRKLPTCATRDVAVVAAGLLLDRSWSGRGSVPILGPEDLSFNDMAEIMSQVLGRPVRFQQIPGEAFKARLTENGTSEAMAQGTLDMLVAKNEGLDNAEPRTPRATTPTTFRQWCEEVLKPAVLA